MSRLGDKQNVYWGYLYLTNLNVVKSAELIQIRHCRIGKAIKTKFYVLYYTNIFKWIIVYT